MEWLSELPAALVCMTVFVMVGSYLIVDRKCRSAERIAKIDDSQQEEEGKAPWEWEEEEEN